MYCVKKPQENPPNYDKILHTLKEVEYKIYLTKNWASEDPILLRFIKNMEMTF